MIAYLAEKSQFLEDVDSNKIEAIILASYKPAGADSNSDFRLLFQLVKKFPRFVGNLSAQLLLLNPMRDDDVH